MVDKETEGLTLKLTQNSKEYCLAEKFSLIFYITQSVGLRYVWIRMISSYSFGPIICTRGHSTRCTRTCGLILGLKFFAVFRSLPYLIHRNSLQAHYSETSYFSKILLKFFIKKNGPIFLGTWAIPRRKLCIVCQVKWNSLPEFFVSSSFLLFIIVPRSLKDIMSPTLRKIYSELLQNFNYYADSKVRRF